MKTIFAKRTHFEAVRAPQLMSEKQRLYPSSAEIDLSSGLGVAAGISYSFR